jgi:hypothetical protein
MNERIHELWRAAAVRDDTVHPWTYDPDMHVEKFAELIIAECSGFLRDELDDHFAAEQLEEHFGVES